ncbi:hypothetical protein [Methylocella sp.]|uniref:hypothetical protein n=1 Tax=Methylocella sp. TaxID=1978226 RepID=UPI0037835595
MRLLRLALLGLAALVAAAFALGLWSEGQRGPKRAATPQEVAARRRAIERTVAAPSDYSDFFARLHSGFPVEYDAFLARAAQQAATRGRDDDLDVLAIEAARGLRRSHGVLAARADGPTLDRYFAARAAMLHELSTADPAACVDFLYGGGRMDPAAFSRTRRALVAALVLSGLEAVQDGGQRDETRGRPTEDDFRSLENALRAQGVSNAAIAALLDGRMTEPPIADAELCEAGDVYLRTLAALPEPARRRIYGFAVELMARS